MYEETKLITCNTHGESAPAFICKHLAENPEQYWFSDLQSKANLHPDAWCSECEEVFQSLGGWTDLAEGHALITMVCVRCYENLRAQSVPVTTEAVQDKWDECVRTSVQKLSEKQEYLLREFKIGEHKRWDWDLDESKLIFSNDGIAAVSAKIAIVGSISTTSETWLWAWANASLADVEDSISQKLTKFGEQSKFTKLTTPYWSADEQAGWEVTAICAEILDYKGAYRTSSENGYTYLLIDEITWIS